MALPSRWLMPAVFWIGLTVALLALWWSGQAGNAWGQARAARVAPLALVVVVGMTLPLIHARRWVALLCGVESDVPTRLAAELTVSAALINYASPGYLGAPAKAVLANRSARVPYGRSLVTMAVEQGLDFLVLLVGSAVALFVIGPALLKDLAPSGDISTQVAVVVGGVLTAVALGALLMRHKIASVVGRMVAAFRALGRRVDRSRVVGLTLLYWLAQVAVVMLLLWALRLPTHASSVLALATLPLLAGQLAPLPGGIGAREAAIVALSGVTGTSATGLLGLAVLQRVLLMAALPLSLAALRAGGLLGERR